MRNKKANLNRDQLINFEKLGHFFPFVYIRLRKKCPNSLIREQLLVNCHTTNY